jgi:hypothetical protein
MSKQEPQSSQPTPQKLPQKVVSQSVKAQAQEPNSKPIKTAPVPKYVSLANERIVNE